VDVGANGTTWITNQQGDIWAIAQGIKVQIPEGMKCRIIPGMQPRLLIYTGGDSGGGGDGGGGILTDIGITKSDSPDPVYAGANLTYTLQITNNGPSDSTGATVLDILPAGVTFISATDGGAYNSGSHTVIWTTGALAKDASTSVSVTVTVNDSTIGTIGNIAIADANEDDNNPANDIASEDTTVNILTDIGITKSDSPDPVYAGANLTYTLQIINNGPSDSTGATVLDTLPAGVTFVSATDGGAYNSSSHTVIWTTGALAEDASTSVSVTVTVNDSTIGTIYNIAIADANEDDNNPANDTASEDTTVNILTDIGITKSDSPDPVYAGANLTYTLQITNNGPSDSTGATVLDILPAGVTFISATDGGAYNSSSHTVIWTTGALAKDASTSVSVTVTVNDSTIGTIDNTAIAYANEDDNNSANDTASEDTTVNRAFARINVQSYLITPSTNTTMLVSICIQDIDGTWARDEDTQDLVDGTHHTTPYSFSVAAGHSYYVWVQREGYISTVKNCPEGWSIQSAPDGSESEAACGFAAEGAVYNVDFNVILLVY